MISNREKNAEIKTELSFALVHFYALGHAAGVPRSRTPLVYQVVSRLYRTVDQAFDFCSDVLVKGTRCTFLLFQFAYSL